MDRRVRRILVVAAAALALLVASVGITLVVVARASDATPRQVMDYGMYRVGRIGKVPRPPPEPASTCDDRWRQDVAYLAAELPRLHANAFHATPRHVFEEAVAHLDAVVPTLTDHQMTIEIMRLVSLVGDGHTTTWSWTGRFRRYPLVFSLLDNRLWIVAADEANADLLGAEVVRIGSATIEDAVERVRPLLSFDSESAFVSRALHALVYAEVQVAVGLQTRRDEATFLVRHHGEGARAVTLTPVEPGEALALRQAGPVPLFQERSEEDAWMTVLPGGIVYLKINRCREPDAFRRLAERVFGAVDAYRNAALIVDLRGNGGGDERVIEPLRAGIRARDLGDGRRLWVVTDGGTHSSATGNAAGLRALGARHAGEPTGDGADGWGEVEMLTLPNSGIEVQYATRYWRRIGSTEPLQPDLLVRPGIEDLLTGHDPVLAAVVEEIERGGQRR